MMNANSRRSTMDYTVPPEFMKDGFMMYCYKVLPCNNPKPHVWSTCPFSHTGERAVRRDPRVFQYSPTICPYMRNGLYCPDGDICCFSHHVFESCLHPSRFKTELCNMGKKCTRRLCFFAHGEDDLRKPSSNRLPPVVPDGTMMPDMVSAADPIQEVLPAMKSPAPAAADAGSCRSSLSVEELRSFKTEDLLHLLMERLAVSAPSADASNASSPTGIQTGGLHGCINDSPNASFSNSLDAATIASLAPHVLQSAFSAPSLVQPMALDSGSLAIPGAEDPAVKQLMWQHQQTQYDSAQSMFSSEPLALPGQLGLGYQLTAPAGMYETRRTSSVSGWF